MILELLKIGPKTGKTTRHKLSGTTEVNGEPAERIIMLYDRITFALLAMTISNTEGEWAFSCLPEKTLNELFVVDMDLNKETNGRIFDLISQVN